MVNCSLVTVCFEREVSTIGAENRAPPGMGSRPIRAVITEPTARASLERRAKLSTSLSMCPDSFMIRLMIRMRTTTASRLTVCICVAESTRICSHWRGARPIQSESTRDPARRERLNWIRNLFMSRTIEKTTRTLTMAGIV